MYRKRGSSLARSRPRVRSQRKFRWVYIQADPTNVPVGTTVLYGLLTPTQPAGTLSDLIYQSMTMPTVAAIYGQVTVQNVQTFSCATTQGQFSTFAWGLYRDVDGTNVSSSIAPWSQAYSNSWLMWRTDVVNSLSVANCGSGNGSIIATNDLTYKRYNFAQRRYKRKMDSFNDTLVFAFENAPTGQSFDPVVVWAGFRILLLE